MPQEFVVEAADGSRHVVETAQSAGGPLVHYLDGGATLGRIRGYVADPAAEEAELERLTKALAAAERELERAKEPLVRLKEAARETAKDQDETAGAYYAYVDQVAEWIASDKGSCPRPPADVAKYQQASLHLAAAENALGKHRVSFRFASEKVRILTRERNAAAQAAADEPIYFVINGPTLGRGRDDAPESVPTEPPGNVDVPALLVNGELRATAAVGDTLEVTDGNWTVEPTDYAYQWKRNGTVNIGDDDSEYLVVAADAEASITCVVTATNDAGSTAAPPSNAVEIDAPVTRRK